MGYLILVASMVLIILLCLIIRCVNVEENMYGEDVAYFVCPVNNEIAESRVYKS